MKLKPTLDRVAIKREEREVKTKGGIHLPQKAQKKSNFGTVVSIGPGSFNRDGSRRPMGVKKGDRVFFTDYHVTETGSDIVIADEEDCLAIIEE